MNKNKNLIIILSISIITIILILLCFLVVKNNNQKIPVTEGITVVPTFDDEITSDSSYCATFQLVWNDMKGKVIKKDIIFNPQNSLADNLNKEGFIENMISDDYYYKAFGPKTQKLKDEIIKGIKNKFNQTSDILDNFDWNEENLDSPDTKRYFFYTMLYREFEYKHKFMILEDDDFGDYKNIKYFGINSNSSDDVRNQITVLFYNSKDDFAIKLATKSDDEVILYKNPKGQTFNEIYNNMNKETEGYKGNRNFDKEDKFKAPIIGFNVKKEYTELQNKPFYDSEGKEYIIDKAIQTINFKLDEKGGKVKSEAAIGIEKTASALPAEPRYFNVDSTFAIFLKESSKDMPYFAARIDNITKYQQ